MYGLGDAVDEEVPLVWFTHSLPQETVRICSALGSDIMVCAALELLQVVGSNHCLWAIWPLSPHCAQWSLVEVVGTCTKESTMTIYLQCLYHLVQQFWDITCWSLRNCGPQFPSWLVPDCGSDWSREGRWLWPVLKGDSDVFQDRRNVCFMDSAGKHTDLRPLLTLVIVAVGVSNSIWLLWFYCRQTS